MKKFQLKRTFLSKSDINEFIQDLKDDVLIEYSLLKSKTLEEKLVFYEETIKICDDIGAVSEDASASIESLQLIHYYKNALRHLLLLRYQSLLKAIQPQDLPRFENLHDNLLNLLNSCQDLHEFNDLSFYHAKASLVLYLIEQNTILFGQDKSLFDNIQQLIVDLNRFKQAEKTTDEYIVRKVVHPKATFELRLCPPHQLMLETYLVVLGIIDSAYHCKNQSVIDLWYKPKHVVSILKAIMDRSQTSLKENNLRFIHTILIQLSKPPLGWVKYFLEHYQGHDKYTLCRLLLEKCIDHSKFKSIAHTVAQFFLDSIRAQKLLIVDLKLVYLLFKTNQKLLTSSFFDALQYFLANKLKDMHDLEMILSLLSFPQVHNALSLLNILYPRIANIKDANPQMIARIISILARIENVSYKDVQRYFKLIPEPVFPDLVSSFEIHSNILRILSKLSLETHENVTDVIMFVTQYLASDVEAWDLLIKRYAPSYDAKYFDQYWSKLSFHPKIKMKLFGKECAAFTQLPEEKKRFIENHSDVSHYFISLFEQDIDIDLLPAEQLSKLRWLSEKILILKEIVQEKHLPPTILKQYCEKLSEIDYDKNAMEADEAFQLLEASLKECVPEQNLPKQVEYSDALSIIHSGSTSHISTLYEALRLNSNDSYQMVYLKTRCLNALGAYSKTQSILQSFLSQFRENLTAEQRIHLFFNLIVSYKQEGIWKKALDMIQQSMQEDIVENMISLKTRLLYWHIECSLKGTNDLSSAKGNEVFKQIDQCAKMISTTGTQFKRKLAILKLLAYIKLKTVATKLIYEQLQIILSFGDNEKAHIELSTTLTQYCTGSIVTHVLHFLHKKFPGSWQFKKAFFLHAIKDATQIYLTKKQQEVYHAILQEIEQNYATEPLICRIKILSLIFQSKYQEAIALCASYEEKWTACLSVTKAKQRAQFQLLFEQDYTKALHHLIQYPSIFTTRENLLYQGICEIQMNPSSYSGWKKLQTLATNYPDFDYGYYKSRDILKKHKLLSHLRIIERFRKENALHNEIKCIEQLNIQPDELKALEAPQVYHNLIEDEPVFFEEVIQSPFQEDDKLHVQESQFLQATEDEQPASFEEQAARSSNQEDDELNTGVPKSFQATAPDMHYYLAPNQLLREVLNKIQYVHHQYHAFIVGSILHAIISNTPFLGDDIDVVMFLKMDAYFQNTIVNSELSYLSLESWFSSSAFMRAYLEAQKVNFRGTKLPGLFTHIFDYYTHFGMKQYVIDLFIPSNIALDEDCITQDYKKRDFTISCLYGKYYPETQTLAVLDPSRMGIHDVRYKILRTVRSVIYTDDFDACLQADLAALEEDPVRILRAFKWITRGYQPTPSLHQALQTCRLDIHNYWFNGLIKKHFYLYTNKMLKQYGIGFIQILEHYGWFKKIFSLLVLDDEPETFFVSKCVNYINWQIAEIERQQYEKNWLAFFKQIHVAPLDVYHLSAPMQLEF